MQDVIEGSRLLANPRPLYYIVKFRLVVMSNQEKERFQQSEFYVSIIQISGTTKKRGGGFISKCQRKSEPRAHEFLSQM